MVKGIIFDLDGTTLDTTKDLQTAVNNTIAGKYELLNENNVKSKVGHGFRNLLEQSMPGATEEEIDEALTRFKKFYSVCYAENTRPYDGIVELLENLQSQGIKLGINSNKGESYTIDLVNKNFPNVSFVLVVGQKDGFPKKPDPSGSNEIIKKMNLSKEEVIYIGDSRTDILTAKNVGVKSIGCLWGFKTKEELEEAKADYIVKSPSEILEIMKKLNS